MVGAGQGKGRACRCSCQACGGKRQPCQPCRGLGQVRESRAGWLGLGRKDLLVECPSCGGKGAEDCTVCKGTLRDRACPECKGTGTIQGPACRECNGVGTFTLASLPIRENQFGCGAAPFGYDPRVCSVHTGLEVEQILNHIRGQDMRNQDKLLMWDRRKDDDEGPPLQYVHVVRYRS